MVSITLILLVLFMTENEDIDVLYSIEIHSALHSKFQALTFQTGGLLSSSQCTVHIDQEQEGKRSTWYLLNIQKHLPKAS